MKKCKHMRDSFDDFKGDYYTMCSLDGNPCILYIEDFEDDCEEFEEVE